MHGYVANIEDLSIKNENFRRVLYTDERLQLVVMSLRPGEDIGMEVHTLDQFIRVEAGEGKAILNDVEHELRDGFVVVVPQGTMHNIVNTSRELPMKLYTLYAPPEHKDGTVHATKAEAQTHEQHFDGVTTESHESQ